MDVTTHRGEKHSKHRLTAADVRYIRTHPELSNADLARRYDVERSTIRLVRANVTWHDPKFVPQRSRFKGAGLKPEYRQTA